MARKIPAFGRSLVDQLVMSWLLDKNIDPADVHGYQIHKASTHSTIKIELLFDDSPADAGHQEGI